MSDIFSNKNIFLEILEIFFKFSFFRARGGEHCEAGGGVGERSEPSDGGGIPRMSQPTMSLRLCPAIYVRAKYVPDHLCPGPKYVPRVPFMSGQICPCAKYVPDQICPGPIYVPDPNMSQHIMKVIKAKYVPSQICPII